MKKLLFLFTLIMSLSVCAGDDVIQIASYNQTRDRAALEKIIAADPEVISYEELGKSAGTTMAYIESHNYTTLVALSDGKPVGFINYLCADFTLCTFYFGRIALIHILGVDSEHRRKGIGSLLLEHACADLEARKAPRVILMVKVDNYGAQKLYERGGFSCPIPEYVREKLPTLCYMKEYQVSPEDLPQGNIIQRHRKLSLLLLACAGSAGLAGMVRYFRK